MKKISGILLLCLGTLLLRAQLSYSVSYEVSLISTPGYSVSGYDLNNNGHVVWTETDGNDYEIYFYDGSAVQLTNDSLNEKNPKINNNDQIVWELYSAAYGSYIELDNPYDTSPPIIIYQSSDDNHGPQINDSGYVVWQGYGGILPSYNKEIYRYNGSSVLRLTSSSYTDSGPKINSSGDIAWTRSDYDGEIFLYSGGNTTQITVDNQDDVEQQISDNGWIVWRGLVSGNSEILLRKQTGSILNISGRQQYSDINPKINSSGYVVWQGTDSDGDYEIYIYKAAGSPIKITNNGFDDNFSEINDNGHVVWSGYDGNDYEIFYWDGISIMQITDNSYDDSYPLININGDMAWRAYNGSNYELYLAIACQNLPTKIEGTTNMYPTLQEAYDTAGVGDVIQIRSVDFDEDVTINADKIVFLEGGYDCNYTNNSGETKLNGNLIVSNGTLIIDSGFITIL